MNAPQELRDVLSWLSAVVPLCLREWRNIDGNLGRKWFFKKTEHVHVSKLSLLKFVFRSAAAPRF